MEKEFIGVDVPMRRQQSEGGGKRRELNKFKK